MYAYQNNKLSIPANILYEDLELITYNTYRSWCTRGKLVRTKEGKGKGNTAWVSYYDITEQWVKNAIKAYLGDPKEVVVINLLEDYIEQDYAAGMFYAAHRKPNGLPLSAEKQREKTTNAMILNAIKTVFNNKTKVFGKQKTKIWENITDAVNDLAKQLNANNTPKYQFSLPGHSRKLKEKYEEYMAQSYGLFIHGGEGAANAKKIHATNGDFLLAQYCLPIKLSIPEVLERYDIERLKHKNWSQLTNGAVYNYLYQPEKERIWTLQRHGREVYNRKYKRTVTREKSNWFPNCYWAIDGTKLDWIHFWDDSSNKMGAKLKIDVMFDVYSEKIIGWDLSFTESHIEHFKTVKMAINESECRPYFLTYDNQGGHKMARMQDLYSSLMAVNGGHHHPNKAKEHGNPAEPIFSRLQKQVINKFWFSDGQSITVKRDDNKVNIDFIEKNKHQLKTVEQLYAAWEAAVTIWNNKQHPLFKETRNQVYAHKMPMQEPISLFDIMDKMWIDQKKKPIIYRAHGLNFRLGDKKYLFEVYDADGNIDLDFREKSIGKKFIVRYDPSFLDGYIQLCDKDEKGNIIHIANAQPKRKVQEVPVLMKPGGKEQWAKDEAIKAIERNRDELKYTNLVDRTGITIEKEMEDQELLIKFKGNLTKVQRSKVEAEESFSSSSFL